MEATNSHPPYGLLARSQDALKTLKQNPEKFFKQVRAKLRPAPQQAISKKINGVQFLFDFAFDPSLTAMYHGLYEVEMVNFIRKMLKPGDTFIDVGANIGYISAVALGAVGIQGQVHSFEPMPQYFSKLQQLSQANPKFKFFTNQCAMGSAPGEATLHVTNLANIGWNTLVPGFMSEETTRETVNVPVQRLDTYIQEKHIRHIGLIKIDTEGFEFPVLLGMSEYFSSSNQRPPILCEVAPDAYKLLGYSLKEFADYMISNGYQAYDVEKPKHTLDITSFKRTTNVVFLPVR